YNKKNKISSKFDSHKKKEKRRIDKILSEFIIKSGFDFDPRQLHKKVLTICMIICSVFSVILLATPFVLDFSFASAIIYILITWIVGLGLLYLLILLGIFFYLDYCLYNRTKEIEEVLPEFLQLTSANISAGMPIDRALWFAVRPKFGVLAKEIEAVAKSTLAGDDLEKALKDFAQKYDSSQL